MPNEDKFAFDIFQQTINYISPYLIIVLSDKAGESIKKQAGDNLPQNIHFLDSEFPSTWSEDKKIEFQSAVDDIAYRWSKYYKRMWFDVTSNKDEYFNSVIYESLVSRIRHEPLNPFDRLDNIIKSKAKSLIKFNPFNIKKSSKKFWFNSYPINIDTDEVFPLFLAICRGDKDLNTVLSITLEQCQKIAEKYPIDMLVKRNVVLLTDKWNTEIFNNFKSRFQIYEINNYIYFIFARITESEVDVKYISDAKLNETISYEYSKSLETLY